MIKELILHGDDDVLRCVDDIPFLRFMFRSGVLFRWNRQGVIKDIHRNVVLNMVTQFDDQFRLQALGVIADLPAGTGEILWSQCQ